MRRLFAFLIMSGLLGVTVLIIQTGGLRAAGRPRGQRPPLVHKSQNTMKVEAFSRLPGTLSFKASASLEPNFRDAFHWFDVSVRRHHADGAGADTIWYHEYDAERVAIKRGQPAALELAERTVPLELAPGVYTIYIQTREDLRRVSDDGSAIEPSIVGEGRISRPIVVH